ncbi:MAG: D-alanyl-D-alanine carboxypeptidase family protein [Thermodesulfobacteriota bacterium]
MIFRKVFSRMVIAGAALLLAATQVAARDAERVVASKHKHAPAATASKGGQLTKKAKTPVAPQKQKKVQQAKKKPGKTSVAAKKTNPVRSVKAVAHYSDPVQGASFLREQLTSRSAVVMDAATGEILYAHNPDLPGQPASTIKVLTGLIAMKSLPNSELVPASKRAAQMPRSKIYLQPGKKYLADDLINAVLLASANDASVALAERIAGSERAFARLMTRKAEALGATNTVCKTANGLTAPGQQTTAHDLATIFRQAMRDEEFCRRMAFTAVKTSDGKLLRSHNRALWQIDGAEGGKTGYTNAARKTYVGKFSRFGHEIVVAILGSESMWEDIRHLVEFGFQAKIGQGVTVAGRERHGEGAGERQRHSSLRLADGTRHSSSL